MSEPQTNGDLCYGWLVWKNSTSFHLKVKKKLETFIACVDLCGSCIDSHIHF